MSWSDNPETNAKLVSYIDNVLGIDEPAVRYNMALSFIASAHAYYGSEPRFGIWACTISMTAMYPQDYINATS